MIFIETQNVMKKLGPQKSLELHYYLAKLSNIVQVWNSMSPLVSYIIHLIFLQDTTGLFNVTLGVFCSMPSDCFVIPGQFHATSDQFHVTLYDFHKIFAELHMTPAHFCAIPGNFCETPGDFNATPGNFHVATDNFCVTPW